MTRGQKTAAAVALLAAAAAAVWGWQSGGFNLQAHLGADADTGPDAGTRLAPGGCRDDGQLPLRHGLYRRHDGHAMRRQLVDGGWDWYLNPPGEASL